MLTALIVLPVVGAAVLALLPESLRARSREIALGIAVVELVLVAVLVAMFDVSASGEIQFATTVAWIPQIGASYAVGVNGLGLSMIVLSAILVPIAIIAGWKDEDTDVRRARYLALVLLSQAFMIAIFAARDVFLFYVLFEAMLIPLYFLIGSYGKGRSAFAAVKFLLFSLAGGLIMLVAVIALYFAGPGGEQAYLIDNLVGTDFGVVAERLMFVGFFIAFAIKAPMVPVHTWLPTVAESARVSTTALLVAVLDKIGTFGMIVFGLTLFPNASAWAAPVVVTLAVISIVYGALAAIASTNLLRFVAFTSVSHFGVMILGIFAFDRLALEGSQFYMLSHGLSTAALFFIVGFLIDRYGTADIREFSGLQKLLPTFAGTFLFIGLSALALPGMSPFVSEVMVLIGSWANQPVATAIAVITVVLAAIYVLVAYQRIFTGPAPETGVVASTPLTELSVRERVATWPLIALMLVLGIFPGLAVAYVNGPAEEVATVMNEAEVADAFIPVPVSTADAEEGQDS